MMQNDLTLTIRLVRAGPLDGDDPGARPRARAGRNSQQTPDGVTGCHGALVVIRARCTRRPMAR